MDLHSSGAYTGLNAATRRGRIALSGLPFLLLICLLCGGCLGNKTGRPGGAASSRVAYVSRDYLPPNNGQTITPPQRMADVTTLWKPMTRTERTMAATNIKKLPLTLQGEPAALAEWLPPSEREVMREYLYRLSVSHTAVTRRSLERAQVYLPAILVTLRDMGLPESLAALPLVESAFEPKAVSSAGAVGLWQLMPATARRYGLTVSKELDERFDPVRSTEAAARYLAFLYQTFGDWPLAVAAYNCGEGAMLRALKAHNSKSLAALSRSCRNGEAGAKSLAEETLRFVPQFVAAVTVMRQSRELGLALHDLVSGPGDWVSPWNSPFLSKSEDVEKNTVPSSSDEAAQPLEKDRTGRARTAPVSPETVMPTRPETVPSGNVAPSLQQNIVPAMRPVATGTTKEKKSAARQSPQRGVAAQLVVKSGHAAANVDGATLPPMKRLSQ